MPPGKRNCYALIILLCVIFLCCSISCSFIDNLFKEGAESTDIVQDKSLQSSNIENEKIADETDSQENILPESAAEAELEVEPETGDYKIAYLDLTSSEQSKHFEHRVANICAVNPDGSDREIIFSDINEQYDLGRVYSASPNGKNLSCMFFEQGRGAYSSLYIIDLSSSELKKIIEFDYTKEEMPADVLSIYGNPIWSNDSSKLFYEVISTPLERPLSGNFRDVGIFCTDVNSGDSHEVELDLGGASIRSTTFLNPVLLTPDDKEIYTLSHIYSPIEVSKEIVGFYSEDIGLYKISSSGGQILEEIFFVESFISEGLDIVSSVGNFQYLKNEDKFVFDVIGYIEEDGDVWISSSDGGNLTKLTNDSNLREQQPTVFNNPEGLSKIAYTGSIRYGTIVNQSKGGDLYIINSDSSENIKITDYNIGVSNPIFSPDGRYISYMVSTYDEYMEYVIENHIEVYDLEIKKVTIIKSDAYIIANIGWI